MALNVSQQAALSKVLASHLPGFLSLLSVDRLTAGASLETYRLHIDTEAGPAKLALRRTPGGADKLSDSLTPSIETEALLIRTARKSGVPGPEIHHVLRDEDGLGQGFVMEWIDGETLGNRIVRGDALELVRPRLAYQCGEILGRIHSIDVDAVGLAEHLHTRSPDALIRHAVAKYESYGVPRPMLDYTGQWLLRNLPPGSASRLVHKDFRNGNLIVSSEGIAAVLDWEHAFIGDPMLDLGWLCCNSWRFGNSVKPVGGFGDYEDLFAGYEAVTGLVIEPQQVRFWEVFASFAWAVGCFELANQYRSGQERTMERLAIGRRLSECEIDCCNILLPGDLIDVEMTPPSSNFADASELLESVIDFLRDEIATKSDARVRYLAKVAANSLTVARREITVGPIYLEQERSRLIALLGHSGSAEDLRAELSCAIRNGTIALDRPDLVAHLRESTAAQIAIDQPRYSGRSNGHRPQ